MVRVPNFMAALAVLCCGLAQASYFSGVEHMADEGVLGHGPDLNLADLNGDQIPDLVKVFALPGFHPAHLNQHGLVRYGQADGSFRTDSLALVQAMAATKMSQLADLNGDGFKDLVHLNANFVLAIYISDRGTLPLVPTTIIEVPPSIAAAGLSNYWGVSAVTADFNNNGQEEVFFATDQTRFLMLPLETDSWIIFWNGVNAQLRPANHILTGEKQYLGAIDLNGDHYVDIVGIDTENRKAIVASRNSYGGRFSSPSELPVFGLSAQDSFVQVDFGDLNQNGSKDLVISLFDQNRIAFCPSNGGSGYDCQYVELGLQYERAATIQVVDVNQDGLMEVLAILGSADPNDPDLLTLAVFEYSSTTQNLEPVDSFPIGYGNIIGHSYRNHTWADMDMDGDLDWVIWGVSALQGGPATYAVIVNDRVRPDWQISPYGLASPGQGQMPEIGGFGQAARGSQSFMVRLKYKPFTKAMLIVAQDPLDHPFMNGYSLLVTPEATWENQLQQHAWTNAEGVVEFQIPLPRWANFYLWPGKELFFQGIFADNASPIGIELTQGLRVRLGQDRPAH